MGVKKKIQPSQAGADVSSNTAQTSGTPSPTSQINAPIGALPEQGGAPVNQFGFPSTTVPFAGSDPTIPATQLQEVQVTAPKPTNYPLMNPNAGYDAVISPEDQAKIASGEIQTKPLPVEPPKESYANLPGQILQEIPKSVYKTVGDLLKTGANEFGLDKEEEKKDSGNLAQDYFTKVLGIFSDPGADLRAFSNPVKAIVDKVQSSTMSKEKKQEAVNSLNGMANWFDNRIEMLNKDQQQNPVPSNIVTNSSKAIAGMLPDIALAGSMGGGTVAKIIPETISKYAPKAVGLLERAVSAPFTKIMAAKGALAGGAEDKDNPDLGLIKGTATGTAEGIYMHVLGEAAGKLSPYISKLIGKTGASSPISTAIANPLANAAVFATGKAISTPILEGRLATPEELESEVGMGIGFSLLHAGQQYKTQSDANKYYEQVLKTDPSTSLGRVINEKPEVLTETYNPNLDVTALEEARNEIRRKILKEPDLEVKKELGTEGVKIQNQLDAHSAIDGIVKNKGALVDMISNLPELTPEQKAMYTERVEAIDKEFNPVEVSKRQLGNQIIAATEAEKLHAENATTASDPVSQMESEVAAEQSKKIANEAQKELKSIVQDQAVQQDLDTKAMAFQRQFPDQVPDVFSDIPKEVINTIDRMESDKPTDPLAIDETSKWLYDKYKSLTAMKKADNRMFTVEQIDGYQERIANDIASLNDYKFKQAQDAEQNPVEIAPVKEAKIEEPVVEPKQKESVSEPTKPTENEQPIPADNNVETSEVQKTEETVAAPVEESVMPDNQPKVGDEVEYNLNGEVIKGKLKAITPNDEYVVTKEDGTDHTTRTLENVKPISEVATSEAETNANIVKEAYSSNKKIADTGTDKEYDKYVKNIFPESKSKEPLYHGSPNEFDNFDLGKLGENSKNTGYFGEGLYFTPKKSMADAYGDKTYRVVLDVKKPFLKTAENFEKLYDKLKDLGMDKKYFDGRALALITQAYPEHSKEITKAIKDMGYDSVVDWNETIVFDPKQVHILGSKKDANDFKDFLGKEEPIPKGRSVSSNELNKIGKAFSNRFGIGYEVISKEKANKILNLRSKKDIFFQILDDVDIFKNKNIEDSKDFVQKVFSTVESADEAKSAYKRLAGKFHPDRDGGSNEIMQYLNNAKDKYDKGGYKKTGDIYKDPIFKTYADHMNDLRNWANKKTKDFRDDLSPEDLKRFQDDQMAFDKNKKALKDNGKSAIEKINNQLKSDLEEIRDYVKSRKEAIRKRTDISEYKKGDLLGDVDYKRSELEETYRNKAEEQRDAINNKLDDDLDKLGSDFDNKWSFQKKGDKIGGFYDKVNKKAYLVEGVADETTAIHEMFSHPFISAVEVEHPELFKNILNEAKNDSQIKEYVDANYGELEGLDRNHEYIAAAIDLESRNKLKNKSLIDYIDQFWKIIKDNISTIFGGKKITGFDKNTKIKDVVDFILNSDESIDLKNKQKIEVSNNPVVEGVKTLKLEVNEDLSSNGIGLRAVEMDNGKFGIFQEKDGKPFGKTLGRTFESIEALNEAYETGIKNNITAEAINKAVEKAEKAPEDMTTAEKIRAMKIGKGKAFESILGIPIAIYDGALETVATAIEAGKSIKDALKAAVAYFKDKSAIKDEVAIEKELRRVFEDAGLLIPGTDEANPVPEVLSEIEKSPEDISTENIQEFKKRLKKVLDSGQAQTVIKTGAAKAELAVNSIKLVSEIHDRKSMLEAARSVKKLFNNIVRNAYVSQVEKAKKGMVNRIKSSALAKVDVVKQFMKINEKELDLKDLEEYNEMVTQLSQQYNTKIEGVVADDVLQKFVDKIADKKAKAIAEEQLGEVEEEEADVEGSKSPEKSSRRKQLEAVVAINRQELKKGGYSEKYKEVAQALNRIDVNNLSNADMVKLNMALINLYVNDRLVGHEKVFKDYIGSEGMKRVKPLEGKVKGILSSELAAAARSLDVNSKIIFKGIKDASEFQSETGIADISNANSKVKNIDMKAIDKDYQSLIKTLNFPDYNTADNRFLRALYSNATQFSSVSGEGKDFTRYKSLIEQSAKKLGASDDVVEQKEGFLRMNQYDQYLKPFETRQEFEEAFKKAQPKNVQIVDFFRNKFNAKYEALKTNSQIYAGKNLKDENNYLPMKWKRYSGTEMEREKELNDIVEPVYDFDPETGDISERQSSTTIERQKVSKIKSTDRILDMDFDRYIFDKYREMNYDIRSLKYRHEYNAIRSQPEFKDVVGGQENANILTKGVRNMVKRQMGGAYDNDVLNGAIKATRVVTGKAVRQALFGILQPLKQYPSVAMRTAINLNTDIGLLFRGIGIGKDNPIFDNFGVGLRSTTRGGTQTETELSKIYKSDFSSSPMKLAHAINRVAQTTADALSKPLTYSDDAIAKHSWLSYYMKYIKDNGGDINKIDWNTEHLNPDMKAGSFADLMVSTTQNTNDNAKQADLLADKKYAIGRDLIAPFVSFARNSQANLEADLRTFSGGTPTEKRKAAVGILSNVSEQVAFNAIKAAIAAFIVKAGANYVRHLFGDDTPGSESEDVVSKVLKNSTSDVLFSGMGSFANYWAIKGVNQANKVATGKDKDLFYQYDPGKYGEPDFGAAGLFGTLPQSLYNMGQKADYLDGVLKDTYTNKSKTYEARVDLSPNDQALVSTLFFLDALSVAGLSDAELSRINQTIFRDVKKRTAPTNKFQVEGANRKAGAIKSRIE